MDFALVPQEGGYPRLWRFVDGGSLGYKGGRPIVSMLLEGNLLKIDRELYGQLNETDRHILLRTHQKFEVV